MLLKTFATLLAIPLLALSQTTDSSSSASSSTKTSSTRTITTATGTLVAPTLAASGISPGVGTGGYSYAGCWNETTGISSAGGARALANGIMESTSNASTATCLTFCAQGSYTYCGIEYGRECWGATYLSAFSTKLDDADCNYVCEGNASEVCGGSLTITLYNLTSEGKSSAASREEVGWGVVGVLGLVGVMSVVFLGF